MSPENDVSGQETLERFADAPAFNRWLYQNISRFCSGKILEIGSGIGNISKLLLEDHQEVMLSDLRLAYCERLQQRFGDHPHFLGARQLDIAPQGFESRYPDMARQFDTIVALNVVEHIKDDALAIANCKTLLREDGKLIVLVPAYQKLFNNFDTELGHYKRYTKEQLVQSLEAAGLVVTNSHYFNLAGIPGWWFTGSVLKKRMIPGGQLKLFNGLVPVFRIMDKVIAGKAGLSVIAVAVKTKK